MAETVAFKSLVEALAEIFGLDEREILNLLIKSGIGNWRGFIRYIALVRREDKSWG